jgi:hypothetical protein
VTEPKITAATRAYHAALSVLTDIEWRQGRSQPRNVYARTGGEDWKADPMIGHFDTPELAAEACASHNAALATRREAVD